MSRRMMFSQKWPDKIKGIGGEPTYFPIMLINQLHPGREELYQWYHDKYSFDWRKPFMESGYDDPISGKHIEMDYPAGLCYQPKKPHTIRTDEKRLYKAGEKRAPAIWIGKPFRSKQFQFAPDLEIVSVQELKIWYAVDSHDPETMPYPKVYIDGRLISSGWGTSHVTGLEELLLLAKNDGFPNIASFFDWFQGGYVGRIVHWTDLRY